MVPFLETKDAIYSCFQHVEQKTYWLHTDENLYLEQLQNGIDCQCQYALEKKNFEDNQTVIVLFKTQYIINLYHFASVYCLTLNGVADFINQTATKSNLAKLKKCM